MVMIRKFEPKDIGSIMQIWLEANINAHHFIPKKYWISQYPSVQKRMPDADVYVYEKENQIQGFAGMTGNYLAGIFVDEQYRSMGIGKSLLEYIKKIYPSFTLTVYQKNQRAADFYKREGLSVVSKGIDASTAEQEVTLIWERSPQTDGKE